MKRIFISVFMVSLLCLCTVGFARMVSAAPSITKTVTDGPDVDGVGGIDIVVETKQAVGAVYEFTITYDNDGDNTDVIIKDTIPAEWNVLDISGNDDPVQEKDDVLNDYDDGNSNPGTFTVFRSGKKSNGPKNKPNNSSTKICWTPDPNAVGTVILVVTVEARNSPSGKKDPEKHAPTSCGLLELNNGATVYEHPLIESPVVVAGPTDPLQLVAVEDIEDDYPRDGSGDKDGDTLTDAEEVFDYGTSPCNDDSDFDGVPDATDNCPTMANNNQADADFDLIGDVCDPDDDNDGVLDGDDQCEGSDDNVDTDEDGIPDGCDECPTDPTNTCNQI